MTTTDNTKQPPFMLSPSLTWLGVFLPALAYVVATRLQHTRLFSGSLGTLMEESSLTVLQDMDMSKTVFYLDHQHRLKQGLYRVQSVGLESVLDSLWKHDEELGRGYLLMSQSIQQGRIWRWEVGGGPIAIGRTLHMEPSGCRSKSYCQDHHQHYGSGAIALDFGEGAASSLEGRLVVAEWGEQRIVRMEVSGARTPLVMTVPSLCNTTTTTTRRRVYQPIHLVYTAFGDLLFADYDKSCQQTALYYLDNAMAISPLSSTVESRRAHSWNDTNNHDTQVQLLYQAPTVTRIGGMALHDTWTAIYVMLQHANDTVQLVQLQLNDDDDEPLWNGTLHVVYSWEKGLAGPVAVDGKHHVLVGVDQQVCLLQLGKLGACLELPAPATSLTVGEDGFLYCTTATDLYRIKIRTKPLKLPTNMVKKKTSNS
jgi:hypothetical protein